MPLGASDLLRRHAGYLYALASNKIGYRGQDETGGEETLSDHPPSCRHGQQGMMLVTSPTALKREGDEIFCNSSIAQD